MNRYISVFGLAARNNLYKLIGTIFVMGAVQVGLFMYTLNNATKSMLLEELIRESKMPHVFVAGFIIYYIVFLCGEASNAMMTTRRLMISERSANWVMAVYNGMALVVFLAAELGICLALCKVYLNSDISGSYEHVIFTAFYRSKLLHPLLPMEDYVVLIGNVLYGITLSILAAYAQQQLRRGKRDFLSTAGAAITAGTFLQDSSSPTMTGPIILVFMAIFAGIYISKGGAVDEDTVYTEAAEETEGENTASGENL